MNLLSNFHQQDINSQISRSKNCKLILESKIEETQFILNVHDSLTEFKSAFEQSY